MRLGLQQTLIAGEKRIAEEAHVIKYNNVAGKCTDKYVSTIRYYYVKSTILFKSNKLVKTLF